MTLWLGLALMTAVAMLAVLWPLARRTGSLRSGSDVAVYRDQLEEIERDRAAGLIADQEAASAQVEVSRRLLAAAEVPPAPQASADVATWRRRAVALVALRRAARRGRTLPCARLAFAAGSAARRRVLPRHAAISRSTAWLRRWRPTLIAIRRMDAVGK